MIDAIIKKFIPNYNNISDPNVRQRYGILGGVLGIICNVILFFIKLVVGIFIGSIAVISDAFNNLSDLGSSLVTVIGARISGKTADEAHPYGHGRAEYISALLIGVLIIICAFELLKSSVEAIITPKEIGLTTVSLVILLLSLPIKLWMWHYNRVMGKRIKSSILIAASRDSRNDLIATSGVIASATLASYHDFPIDGVVGVCVSLMIFWTGFTVARDTIDSLLGSAPSDELIQSIENKLMSCKYILGTHGLMVHDYGPGRIIASVHAEVPDDLSLTEVHNVIDKIEHEIMQELFVDIVIHMDPVPNTR